jgi:predicted transcriptional regulator of viral defense system
MQYLDLKTQLKDFPVFSIKDIEKVDLSFHKQRLSEWQKKGYVKKICKGFYIFSDLEINEQALFTIANRVYEPSYISLEMALSIYGLIPEAVYSITSVTSQKTRTLKTPVGNFIYRHTMPELLFGYQLREHNGHHYQIAEIEKAILDYLYFNVKMNDEESFKGMRFNVGEIKERVDMEKFNKYLDAYHNKALVKRAKKFLTYINHA